MYRCGLMISKTRNRLNTDIVKASKCWKAWNVAGIVESTMDHFGKELEMD